MVTFPTPVRPGSRGRTAARGFTFIELIVVMGVLAMLMGLTVGYIRSAGRVNALAMARVQVLDAARRAQGLGRGDKLALITFRHAETEDGRPVDEVFTLLAQGVLTHAFETLDGASRSLPAKAGAGVKIVPGGRPGSCAQFGRGAAIEFDPQPSFAMTDGIDCEMWLMPDPGSNVMTLVDGRGSYEVALVRGGTAADYDLRLRVNLRPKGEARDEQGEPSWLAFESEGAPVRTNGQWTHVHVRFDGLSASLEVDGLECTKRAGASAPADAGRGGTRRLAVPLEGAVALTLGSTAQSYVGKMDSLVLRGVFRLKEDRTFLPDGVEIEVLDPPKQALPFRVHYVNGALDPLRHAGDVRIALRDGKEPGALPLVLVLGRHGAIRADYERSAAPAGDAPAASPPRGSEVPPPAITAPELPK